MAGAPASSAGQQETATAGVLAYPAGRWLVALVGVAVAGMGIGLAVYGVMKGFEKRLLTAQMSGRTQDIAVFVGRFGYIAKGTAYAIVGVVLVTQVAFTNDASHSRGLDQALRTLPRNPSARCS